MLGNLFIDFSNGTSVWDIPKWNRSPTEIEVFQQYILLIVIKRICAISVNLKCLSTILPLPSSPLEWLRRKQRETYWSCHTRHATKPQLLLTLSFNSQKLKQITLKVCNLTGLFLTTNAKSLHSKFP